MKNYLICKSRDIYYKFYEKWKLKKEREKSWLYSYNVELKPLITIITPTYNRADMLMNRALSSVLQQTYQNWEYIIVGDGCIDLTEKNLNEIRDPRIKFYNLERKREHHTYNNMKHWYLGGSYPANYALKNHIRGKWIARIDDDDIWESTFLEKVLKFAQEGNFELISTKYTAKRYDKTEIYSGVHLESPYFYPKKKGINLESPKFGGHSTMFYRSYLKFFKYNVQAWRKKWNKVDDVDLVLRMHKAGVRMGFLNETLMHVTPREGEETIGSEAVLSKIKKDKIFTFKINNDTETKKYFSARWA